MKEFFVIIFGGEKYFQYRISDIIANSFNGIVSEEYSFLGIRYYFPIVAEGGKYFIDPKNNGWAFKINNNFLADKTELKSGDFINITFKNISLIMTIIEYSKCSLNSQVFQIEKDATYFIGRHEESHIVINSSGGISRKHASISIDMAGRAMIEDISGKIGVYVNGKKVIKSELKEGDHIFIVGTTVVYYRNFLIIPSNVSTNSLLPCERIKCISPIVNPDNLLYIRTPRIQQTLDTEPIEIDLPTPYQPLKELPFLLTVGPSLTMLVVMMSSLGITINNVLSSETKNYISLIPGGMMIFSMLLGALLWPKLTRNYHRKMHEKSEKHRQERYREYLAKKDRELALSYEKNTKIWNETLYPSCEALVETANSKKRKLWERGIKDDDFLGVRLGLGERPFEKPIGIKKREFELEEDILKNEAYEIADKYVQLKNVPICLSLKEHNIAGVVGDYDDIAVAIILNLVTLYAPDELKIVLIYNRNKENLLRDFNDLPHMWSTDKTSRYVATTETEAYSLFGDLDEKIKVREESLGNTEVRNPHFVILSFDQTIMESVSFKKVLLNVNPTLGISSVFFGERFNQIPKECKAIIQKNEEICGIYVKNENDNKFTKFVPDVISDVDVNSLVKSLSQIEFKREKAASNIPSRISFLDVYQVGNIEALNISSHWNSNASNKTLAAPIGVMSGGDVFYLDIHEKYHGCHGLVAGTTGSGKSEFLQAYILSMMINYSPNEVAFVLVDFKGGDMARPFLSSPHLAATISNLSGNTLYRALVSLEAEVKNRQRIFNQSASALGIDKIDINSYHRYYKEKKLTEALPHLVIVIDEFAQLKIQHPEFLEKLVDVAQVGRSLGIHLILATQKPSGVVDPQIWSNSRFKVCLKVMDKQDSSDMINKPLAALIKIPGRAYVQVGYDEVFELVQSGYSGADYTPQDKFINEDSVTVSMVNWPAEQIRQAKDLEKIEKTNVTQLEAVMKLMSKLGGELNLSLKKLWLDPLQDKLRLEMITDVDHPKGKLGEVVCGLMDLPHIQKQVNCTIDFIEDGHLAIYGSSGTGKSTFIQTIFYSMAISQTPKTFNSFVIDFNGGSLSNLSNMPHCIKYASDENENEVIGVLNNIGKIMQERRKIFKASNCVNYRSYLSEGHDDMSLILVAIDNYASFREKMYKSEELLVQHISSSKACGIYFIITGNSKSAIYYKVTDHIANKVIFTMNDTGSYRDILNTRVPIYPENVKGRALIINEKIAVEMQVAVPFDAESEVNRMNYINTTYSNMLKEYGRTEYFGSDDESAYIEEMDIEEEKVEDYYKAQEMRRYSCTDDVDCISMGIALNEKSEVLYSFHENSRLFITNVVNNQKIIPFLCKELKKIEKEYKIYSQDPIDNLDEKDFISDIDAYISNFEQNDEILIINGFTHFFDEISDESLDILEKLLAKNPDKQIITLDSMERINDYNSSELAIRLVKCDGGLVIGGKAENSLAMSLNHDFYDIPEYHRNVELNEDEAILYVKNTAVYVKIGGNV